MKIVLWIGNEPLQKALANKIHSLFPLAGIVTETRSIKRKITLPGILGKIFEKLFLRSVGKSWWNLLKYYNSIFPDYPDVKLLNVENINSTEALEFSKGLNPDLVIVSGTRLIKSKMLSLKPEIGILNLHTGLSPYIKGGPNCTNWCIATKQFHLIGNTVMWIDSGIDTGNILTSDFTEFDGNENLLEIHIKVIEHGHSLCIKSINFLLDRHNNSIPQKSISIGKTYYSKDWDLTQKIKLILNIRKFRNSIKSGQVLKDRESIITVKI